jgi:hypothetical protein
MLGLGVSPFSCRAVLPRVGCKQFEVKANLWYAKLNASTVKWGTDGAGTPGTELDLYGDLDLPLYKYIPEYEARLQLKRNWGLRYSYMPMKYEGTQNAPQSFYWGYALYPIGAHIRTKWDRHIHKADLIYDWFQGPHAVSSIFAGYSYYDDRLSISSPNISPVIGGAPIVNIRTRGRHFGLAFAGMSMDRVFRDIAGGTASINCKGSVSFLEGYIGWDGSAVGRLSIPMHNGRFGYVEAGWRWISVNREYDTDADKTSLDGFQIASGLVF